MNKKSCFLIPEEEKKCVWMTAGQISYKLCEHDYCCETCMFDQGMRNVSATGLAFQKIGEALSVAGTSFPMRWSRFYHPGHCWVKIEDPDDVRIGVDDVLTRLMSGVKAVILAREGEQIRRGECCGHIIHERHIIPLIAPLNGTIRQANKRLQKEPGLVMTDPWDAGWMAAVKPAALDRDIQNLLFGKKAFTWYQKKHRDLTALCTALQANAYRDIGPTMQDGGEKINVLAELLSPGLYCQILEAISRDDD